MELVRSEKELNTKQKAFCREFLFGEFSGNGTKCYRKAYEVVGEMLSDATCGSCASALLASFHISQYLRTLSEEAAERLQAEHYKGGEAENTAVAGLSPNGNPPSYPFGLTNSSNPGSSRSGSRNGLP